MTDEELERKIHQPLIRYLNDKVDLFAATDKVIKLTKPYYIEKGRQMEKERIIEWIKAHSEWVYGEYPREQWLHEPINDRYYRTGIKITLENWQALKGGG